MSVLMPVVMPTSGDAYYRRGPNSPLITDRTLFDANQVFVSVATKIMFQLDIEHDRLEHGVSREGTIAMVGALLTVALLPVSAILSIIALPVLLYGGLTYLADLRKLRLVTGLLKSLRDEFMQGSIA